MTDDEFAAFGIRNAEVREYVFENALSKEGRPVTGRIDRKNQKGPECFVSILETGIGY